MTIIYVPRVLGGTIILNTGVQAPPPGGIFIQMTGRDNTYQMPGRDNQLATPGRDNIYQATGRG